jgi:hypothetical protein
MLPEIDRQELHYVRSIAEGGRHRILCYFFVRWQVQRGGWICSSEWYRERNAKYSV